jgi:hypothetical protein
MQNFQVQTVRHLGKKAWAIVRYETDLEPVMVGIHYHSPSLALRHANAFNLLARMKARAAPGLSIILNGTNPG